MRTATRWAGLKLVLFSAGCTFFFVLTACSADVPVSPDARAPALRLSRSSVLETRVTTELTENGKTIHSESKALKASLKKGELQSDDTTSITPVLGLLDGALEKEFDKKFNDTLRVVAVGKPTKRVTTYLYGKVFSTVDLKWKKVPGGYVLVEQRITEGNREIVSVVSNAQLAHTGPAVYLANRVMDGLDRIACALGPSVAYAYLPCVGIAADFLWNTIGLGIASAALGATIFPSGGFAVVNPWAIPIYFGGWASWTFNLFGLLGCINDIPTGSGPTDGGGGR